MKYVHLQCLPLLTQCVHVLPDTLFQAFRPFARFWLPPLIDVLVKGIAGTEGINYFMVDLVVTLLSWHSVAIPEVRVMSCLYMYK